MAELLTTAQVAERLGRSVSYVNQAATNGRIVATLQLPGAKGARLYHPAEVDRFAATIEVAS